MDIRRKMHSEPQFEFRDYVFEQLSKAVHTAEDGAEHPIEYHDSHWGTCQEMTYTDGLYCAECGEYIEGHLEYGYGWHEDEDADYICDLCGEIMIEDLFLYSDFSFLFDIMIEFLEFIEKVITVMFAPIEY